MTAGCAASSYQHATAFLLDRIDYERALSADYGPDELRLEPMRELVARLDNPLAGLRVVHVAGTKGKGSTSAMLAAILTAAGHRTGLFSSPHLYRVEERMAVDGRIASEEEFISLAQAVRPHVEAMDRAAAPPGARGPTYFDVTTAMSLLHFRRKRATAAVLEVGLGGRLDSTNVCEPEAAVITSISFDHTRQLGDTLARIAAEKAGIIKPRIPAISGVTIAEPREVVRRIAGERGADLVELDRDFAFDYQPPRNLQRAVGYGSLSFQPTSERVASRFDNLQMGSPGRHQAANAAIAVATIDVLNRADWRIPEAAIRAGLAETCCSARVEVVRRSPTVVLDAAHNVASVEALLTTLDESFSVPRRVLVFATSQDKNYREMLRLLLPGFDTVILTRYQSNPRGVSTEDLARACRELGYECPTARDADEAWQQSKLVAGRDDLICVTGSFYFAAEMRTVIEA